MVDLGDLRKLAYIDGYTSCKFEYCERDESAAEYCLEEYKELALKYGVDYGKYVGREDIWDATCGISYEIQQKILEEN